MRNGIPARARENSPRARVDDVAVVRRKGNYSETGAGLLRRESRRELEVTPLNRDLAAGSPLRQVDRDLVSGS